MTCIRIGHGVSGKSEVGLAAENCAGIAFAIKRIAVLRTDYVPFENRCADRATGAASRKPAAS